MSDRRGTPDRWIRLSAAFQLDPRIMALPAEAELLYVRALALARQTRQDGHVRRAQLDFLALKLASPADAVRALVDSGLWLTCRDGYRVPENTWARWQSTEQEIAERLAASRARQAKSRAARRFDDETREDVAPDEPY